MNEKNIKASNLMLGDWVYAGERLKNVQVACIYEHSICTEDGFWESEEVDEENLSPILLTKELIESIIPELTKTNIKIDKSIYYVHQLQHFLKDHDISLYINIDNDYSEYEDW